MAVAWTYSDWITYDVGSSTRLSRLRLHIKEVSDELKNLSLRMGDQSIDPGFLATSKYLERLQAKEEVEAASATATTDAGATFVRGAPVREGDGQT